jgi:hypothetical protein
MRTELGLVDPTTLKKMPPVVEAGILRTTDGIRTFEVPNPFDPITKAVSGYVDFPLNPTLPMTTTTVDGIVAVAGPHALRLSGGKLWETSDGWTTWTPVEPPPSGVPADLGGAMCSDAGCVLGSWARLGWDR